MLHNGATQLNIAVYILKGFCFIFVSCFIFFPFFCFFHLLFLFNLWVQSGSAFWVKMWHLKKRTKVSCLTPEFSFSCLCLWPVRSPAPFAHPSQLSTQSEIRMSFVIMCLMLSPSFAQRQGGAILDSSFHKGVYIWCLSDIVCIFVGCQKRFKNKIFFDKLKNKKKQSDMLFCISWLGVKPHTHTHTVLTHWYILLLPLSHNTHED